VFAPVLRIASQVGLWLSVVVLYAAVYALYRRFAEVISQTPRASEFQGPSIRSRAPTLSVRDPAGEEVSIGDSGDRVHVILWISTQVQAVNQLMRMVQRGAARHREHVCTTVIFGELPLFHQESSGSDAIRIGIDRNGIARKSWKIWDTKAPFVVLLDADGRVRYKTVLTPGFKLDKVFRFGENLGHLLNP
jgi:hypothetical protein